MTRRLLLFALALEAAACGGDDADTDPPLSFVAVTFNTGTTEGMSHDAPPDDGYTSQHALYSDQYYGDGLAWIPAVEATRAFLAEVDPEIVVFQEIFHAEECGDIPAEARTDFICETWQPGDPTVANQVLGPGWQVACHLGKNDKCAAVKRSFGSFRGCDADFCLEGLDGFRVETCGNGSRVGRGVIDLVSGGTFTLINFHGTSGMGDSDEQCRKKQVEQVFVDFGDGAPAASGERNLVLGDLNTDPGRMTGWDPSAVRWNDFVGPGQAFHWITEVGEDALRTYGEMYSIDHVVSDSFSGSCWHAGVTEGHPNVIEAMYFDHRPAVCSLKEEAP